jgi:hypothetical protein
METGTILELESKVTLRCISGRVAWVMLHMPDFPC